jgi:hypothetical protein
MPTHFTSTERPSGGRDHPGTTGAIISEQTGGIIGIRNNAGLKDLLAKNW